MTTDYKRLEAIVAFLKNSFSAEELVAFFAFYPHDGPLGPEIPRGLGLSALVAEIVQMLHR